MTLPPPPFETTPVGQTWCNYHGQAQLVDEQGNPAASGLCQYCWGELHSDQYTSCGEHGIQEKKPNIEGCSICYLAKRETGPPPKKFAPPVEEFGDTESEPRKAVAPEPEEPAPAHQVEDKPESENEKPKKKYKYGGQ